MLSGTTSSGLAGSVVAFGVTLVWASVFAQSADWRALRIDGSTPERFAASVVSLQNALPAGGRDKLEIALAAIWIGNATAGDIDKNGFFFELADVGKPEPRSTGSHGKIPGR